MKKQQLTHAELSIQREAQNARVWAPELHSKYEKIDKLAIIIMLSVEEKCSPTYPTICAWGAKMRNIGLKVRY